MSAHCKQLFVALTTPSRYRIRCPLVHLQSVFMCCTTLTNKQEASLNDIFQSVIFTFMQSSEFDGVTKVVLIFSLFGRVLSSAYHLEAGVCVHLQADSPYQLIQRVSVLLLWLILSPSQSVFMPYDYTINQTQSPVKIFGI